jgi:fatty-acyl-CoA synthase
MGGWDPLYTMARFAGVSMWGPGIASMVAASATRFPTRTAIIDEAGPISYRTLDRHATNLAAYLRRQTAEQRRSGASEEAPAVGILGRNHRWFVIAQVAAERAGLDVVMMSPALPAPQLSEVLGREAVSILIADTEFDHAIAESGTDVPVLSADGDGRDSLAAVCRRTGFCPPPARRSRLVLLTSGTTGPPKGARRANQAPGPGAMGLFTEIPFRVKETFLVCPPLFHAWGLSQATIALATGSTLILRRKFDAAEALRLLAEHSVDVLAVVPLMLRRMLRELGDHEPAGRPRMTISSGNVLTGTLAESWMDRFGERLWNVYGSTEAAVGTVAGPADLRAAPGTVGRPPPGVTLSILDAKGMPAPTGKPGRVFVSSSLQFSGYSDGTDRDRSGTLMATGDLGYLDDDGRLHIDGRANDMIVTGGENLFPSRVEEVLDHHPGVELSAVVGAPDEEYGQRVVAFVVPRPGWTIDIDELRRTAAADLQSFMVPREVHIVDALPMTVTGKVIRHRLAVLGEAKHT